MTDLKNFKKIGKISRKKSKAGNKGKTSKRVNKRADAGKIKAQSLKTLELTQKPSSIEQNSSNFTPLFLSSDNKKENNSCLKDLDIDVSSLDDKSVFLHFLGNCDSLRQAVKKCGVSQSIIYRLLKTDTEFRLQTDEILNKKLEFAAVDTALGGNSSLLTLMLTNRMPSKYKTKQTTDETIPYSKIIYIDAENKNHFKTEKLEKNDRVKNNDN